MLNHLHKIFCHRFAMKDSRTVISEDLHTDFNYNYNGLFLCFDSSLYIVEQICLAARDGS